MLFLLIFPVLVAGFYACHINPIHYYRLHRYEGQYLYLKSAELGLKCFFIAFVLISIGHFWIPDSISTCMGNLPLSISAPLSDMMRMMGGNSEAEVKKMGWFLELSVLSFIGAFILKAWGHTTLFIRFRTWQTKVFVIGGLLEDSPLDHLLFRLSLNKDKYVMLTMSDRKVYVGKVISLGEPSATNGMDKDISIIPLMSGYRDKDKLTVEFVTRYADIDQDIDLSLRQDEIVSATEFSFEAYEKWNAPVQARQTI